MPTKPILSRDIYVALAAVGWADGQLTPEAADAIVRTALEEGLDIDDIQQIEEATKEKVDVGEIDRMNMTKSDRLYVYAVASWIAELDGPMSGRHHSTLAQLGDALGIPEVPRQHADEIMREVATRGDRPDRFDLLSLRKTLDARLSQARQQRLENMVTGEQDVD
jgi:uncharacterized membrane protein YebE (DUF533 family)